MARIDSPSEQEIDRFVALANKGLSPCQIRARTGRHQDTVRRCLAMRGLAVVSSGKKGRQKPGQARYSKLREPVFSVGDNDPLKGSGGYLEALQRSGGRF